MKHDRTFWNYCWSIFFFALMVLSILGLIFWGQAFHSIIESQVGIKTRNGFNTYMTNQWISPTVIEKMRFRLFHWQNPEDVMRNRGKPYIEQIGPIIYDQTDRKQNVTFSPGEVGSQPWVMYRNIRTWHYSDDQMMPKCSGSGTYMPNINQSTLVSMPNLVLQGVIATLSADPNDPDLQQGARAFNILSMMMGMKPYVKQPAQQVIFTGYVDPFLSLIDVLKAFPNFFAGIINQLPTALVALDKCAIFYNYNATDDGWYNISTGQIDLTTAGQLNEWRHHANLDGPDGPGNEWWSGDEARILNGSDNGEMQPAFMETSTTPTVFESYICRTYTMYFDSITDIKGIRTYRYKIPGYLFNTSNPVEADFSTPNVSNIPEGMIMPPCQAGQYYDIGTPVTLSAAQFDNCDDEQKNSISLRTDPNDECTEKDFGYFDYDYLVGAPMHFKFSVQINSPMKTINGDFIGKYFSYYHSMAPVYIPNLWLFEEIEANDDLANYIVLTTQTLPFVVILTLYFTAGISILMILLCCTCPLMRNACCADKQESSPTFETKPDVLIVAENGDTRDQAMSMRTCFEDNTPIHPELPNSHAPIAEPRQKPPEMNYLQAPEKTERFLSFSNEGYSSDENFGDSSDVHF